MLGHFPDSSSLVSCVAITPYGLKMVCDYGDGVKLKSQARMAISGIMLQLGNLPAITIA